MLLHTEVSKYRQICIQHLHWSVFPFCIATHELTGICQGRDTYLCVCTENIIYYTFYALLVYARDNNLLSNSINTREKGKDDLLNESQEVDLEATAEKCKYMFMSHDQNVGQNNNIEQTQIIFTIWMWDTIFKNETHVLFLHHLSRKTIKFHIVAGRCHCCLVWHFTILLTLQCHSIPGERQNIIWTFYVSQMVLMLNMFKILWNLVSFPHTWHKNISKNFEIQTVKIICFHPIWR